MPKPPPTVDGSTNRLLSRLPPEAFRRLAVHLQPVTAEFNQVLYEFRGPLRYAYFPTRAVTSSLTLMGDGSAIEVATVGNEGMVGPTTFLGAETSPHRVIVQVAGDVLRMRVGPLQEEAAREGPVRRLLIRYHSAFLGQISQSVACNGLHNVKQRCCRWLLMTRDRVQSNDIPLTHEFLAAMLGVRRSSISQVLNPLRKEGLLRYSRGMIHLLDADGLEDASCECYRAVQDEFERLLG